MFVAGLTVVHDATNVRGTRVARRAAVNVCALRKRQVSTNSIRTLPRKLCVIGNEGVIIE